MNGFYKTYIDIFDTIDECLKNNRVNPALILLYSAIDSFSFLTDRENKKSKQSFIDWVDKWMLNKPGLNFSSIDIYAARCGLLHRQTSESDLSMKKEAKEFYYVHGSKPIEPLNASIKNTLAIRDKVIAIRIEELLTSFRIGMDDCMTEIRKDYEWDKEFRDRADKYFVLI
jgi:hypothetical protein